LNEAAGREFRRLWGLRAPQACPIRGQVAGIYGRIDVKRAGAAGEVCNSSQIVGATPIAARLSVQRLAVGHGGDGDIGDGILCSRVHELSNLL
jgi:hypothetical protein